MKQDDIDTRRSRLSLSGFSVLASPANDGFFIVQVAGLDGNKAGREVEVRGANLYATPNRADAFVVVPIYPPVFYNGSLRCLSDQLTWFIDHDRVLYLADSLGNGAILKDGELIEHQSPRLFSCVQACIKFLDWLEAELQRAERGDALVQVLIMVNDETPADFPRWLVEMPSLLKEWGVYKANYKSLCAIGQGAI